MRTLIHLSLIVKNNTVLVSMILQCLKQCVDFIQALFQFKKSIQNSLEMEKGWPLYIAER